MEKKLSAKAVKHLQILKKYKTYVSNLDWHIKTNKPVGSDLILCEIKLDCYNEIVRDLEN